MKKRLAFVGLGIVVVAALAAAAIWFGPWRDDETSAPNALDAGDPPVEAALAFAKNWQAGTLAKSSYTPDSGDVPAVTAFTTSALASTTPGPKVEVTKVERSEGAGDRAMASATVTWSLPNDRTWTYPTSFALRRTNDRWQIAWTPAVIEPSLTIGDVLQVSQEAGTRGTIVDAAGKPLVPVAGSVTIGIRKSRTDDPVGTARTVATITGVDLAQLLEKVSSAGPDDFVEVTTLDRAAYDRIRERIQPLPGTVFREDNPMSDLPPNFAKGILGSVGPASAEIAAASKGEIAEGEVTGLSGLQASQNKVLAGTPTTVIEAVRSDGSTPRALKSFPGTPGKNVAITIDQRVQTAAAAVMAGSGKPAALVAIRASTGDILAIANGPSDSATYNRALDGRYPPGSSFKIVSTFGLLGKGLTPDTIVDCPATLRVGKIFKNAGGEVLGPVPFRTDFAESCNTAFVGQASNLTPQELADAASTLGYRKLDIGLRMFTASVPTDGDATEHAAQMIGQGRVEGNTLNVALTSASIASGTSVQPRIIIDPKDPKPAPGPALPADRVAVLRDLMRAVVTSGTGTALAGVPGDPVQAKTGTAEFGTASPPETHAWITGYQGDIAFAVVVEGGGFGGSVAAPLAADFLTRLAAPG